MDIIKQKTAIDFMGKGKLAWSVSAILIIISLISLGVKGLNFGLDFTGGTLIEVTYPATVDVKAVTEKLIAADIKDPLVQTFGSTRDVVIRLPQQADEKAAEISNRVLEALQQGESESIDLRRVDFVGPKVGEELANQGSLAMLFALLGILVYVTVRFQFKFSLGAILALVHDVVITMGLFSILQIDFDLSVLAALLAVVGYSLNDTIVVFDRIRENFRTQRKVVPVEVINNSINQMLSRTIMTSFTTLLVLLALLIFGPSIIFGFTVALITGVVVGTYSSIFIAANLLLTLKLSKLDLMQVEKEGADLPNTP